LVVEGESYGPMKEKMGHCFGGREGNC
jgi:hypothetical protein